MRVLGINITLGFLIIAFIFYMIGARRPGLANRIWPA